MLRHTGFTTIYTAINQRRLRWLGHVLRMSDECIPKALLYSELVVGKRNFGRPRLRYKDVCKRDLKSYENVDIDEWEWLNYNRNKWRSLIMERQRERENQLFRRPKTKKKEPEWFFLYFYYYLYHILYLLYFFINITLFTVCCLYSLFFYRSYFVNPNPVGTPRMAEFGSYSGSYSVPLLLLF